MPFPLLITLACSIVPNTKNEFSPSGLTSHLSPSLGLQIPNVSANYSASYSFSYFFLFILALFSRMQPLQH